MNLYALTNFRQLPESPIEALNSIQLASEEVLVRVEDFRTRTTNLDKAIVFAKHPSLKTFVTVLDENGSLFKFRFTVIGHNAEYLTGSQGHKIPIKSILSIDFF